MVVRLPSSRLTAAAAYGALDTASPRGYLHRPMKDTVTDDRGASSTNHALEAAIRSRPDDDLPRLVYADWLEEEGEPERALFIRLQCSASERGIAEPVRRRMLLEAERIWSRNYPRWATAYGPIHPLRLTFDRGFPDAAQLTVDEFGDLGAGRLRADYPTLKGVWLIDVRPSQTERLRGLRGIGDFGRVSFAGNHHSTGAVCNGLDGADWMGRVRELEMSTCGLNDHSSNWLLLHPGLTGEVPPLLRRLGLSLNGLGDSWVDGLAGSPALAAVEDLDLSYNPISDAGACALSRSPYAGRLAKVNLTGTLVSAAGVASVVNSARLPRLQTLQMNDPLDQRWPHLQALVDRQMGSRITARSA